MNEKYPDGWCVEECNKVIYDLNSYYDSIFKGGSYFYGVKGINSYNDNIVFGTKITKSEYLQLTGREIKDEPTHINPELPNVPHYGGNNNHFEDIKIINHYNLNFNIGNVIKYVLRDKEDRISDLKKAVDYLNFEIKKYENK